MNAFFPRANLRSFGRIDNRAVAAESDSFLPNDAASREPGRFGVGYGHSSGYVSRRRYSSDWGPARFSVR